MTQVSNFSAVSTICLWCWQSLHMQCGNGQGPVSVLELSGGISDILSIFGEHLQWEVEMSVLSCLMSFFLYYYYFGELCLISCISSTGSHRFCAVALLTCKDFLKVDQLLCLGSVQSYGLCLHLQVQCSHCARNFWSVCCKCSSAFCVLWKQGREERSVGENVRSHWVRLGTYAMWNYTYILLSNNWKWGNETKAASWSAKWSTAACIWHVSWGRCHLKTALKVVAGVLFWRSLKWRNT